MRKYKVHYMVLDIAMGVFKTFDEAMLFADSWRKGIEKICKENGCNCLFYIALSISEEEQLYRTSRGSRLINEDEELLPHLHGICLVEKQSTIAHKLVTYLKATKAIKEFKRQHPHKKAIFTESIHEPAELQRRLLYRVSQAYKFRIVDTCTEQFAKKYAGEFVSLIEEKEKAMGGSKLVFPKYANIDLGTDKFVYDFSKSTKSKNENANADEVWNGTIKIGNEVDNTKTISVYSKYQENIPILPFYGDNQSIFSHHCLNFEPIDTKELKRKKVHCKIRYNKYYIHSTVSPPDT